MKRFTLPPPKHGSPPARTQRSNPGCSVAALVLGMAAVVLVQVLGSWIQRSDVTAPRYDLTDSYGVSVPFRFPSADLWLGRAGVFVCVAVPCLAAFAIALRADRRRSRSLVACFALLVFSITAVGGGFFILSRPTATPRCAACLQPTDIGRSSCKAGFTGGDYFETVPCPADFQQGAERVEQVIDRDAIILMVFGGVGILAGLVLLIRARRRDVPV